MHPVVVEHIFKSYPKGKTNALEDVSFEVNSGELFGLIGPDGAGKTSLFRILTTLLYPNQGKAFVAGLDVTQNPLAIRKKIGYMPGKFSLYQDLTIEENLHFFATLFGTTIHENYFLIEDIYKQIEPFKHRKAGQLSGGMKQKLALSCALIHKPEVLFLDEPTTGVDAVSRKEFWEMLQRLKKEGISILVSTPYMDEAGLCNRIALINEGKIMAIDTPEGIIQSYPDTLYRIRSSNRYALKEFLSQQSEIASCFAFGDELHIRFQTMNSDLINQFMHTISLQFDQVEWNSITPGIEDCFIQRMNA